MRARSLLVSVALLIATGWASCVIAAEPSAAPDADLQQRLRTATKLETIDLCEPVNSVRMGMTLWVPNRDWTTWDLLQIYFPQYGGPNTIVIIDLGTGEVKKVQTERGWNFHLCPSVVAPNGKLFISILDGRLRQKICLYDPATNEFKLDAVRMPEELLGETHPLVLGTDGKLYAIGQHPSKAAAAAQIDPDTLQVTFYGPIGPSHAPSDCWGYSGGADDRYIYIASGKVPWYLVACDRQTGKSETLATTETVGGYVGVSQRVDGCTGSVSKIAGSGQTQNYWLHEGRAIPTGNPQKDKPPFFEHKPPRPLPPHPEVNTGLTVPDVEGRAEIWVRTAEEKARVHAAAPADAAPEHLGWRRFRFQVPLYPHSIYRLFELPDGRLLGTAGAYEGNFLFDPSTNTGTHLGKIDLSHYATAIAGGKVYMSGYPTSPLYVFDPAKPWTTGKFDGRRVMQDTDEAANPRKLSLLGAKELAGTHKMYAGATGADGKVYFGGRWVRDGSGGGLAWYDPATGKAAGTWEPFSNYQITHLAAVNEGRTLVISTRRIDDPVLGKPKPEQGELLLFDVAAGKLNGQFTPVPKAKGTGPIVCVGGSRVLGWTEDPADEKGSILYVADTATRSVVVRRSLPYKLPVGIGSNQQEAWDFRLGPDNHVWTFVDNVLVRIDPQTGDVQPVGRPASPGPIAFSGGKVYLGGTTKVRRVAN